MLSLARPHHLAALVVVIAVGTACAPPPATSPGEGPATSVAEATPPTTTDLPTSPLPSPTDVGNSTATRIAAVLGRLPDCEDDERATVPVTGIDGLILPPESRPVDVTVDGNLTTVEARVPLNPVQVRQFYEYQNLGVLKSLMIEDEILEAEALVESRTHRMFVKAQAVCPTEATIYVVVAPGGSDARLPQPGDSDAPGGPAPTVTPTT